MDIRILPRRLSGAVTPPPSKSQAHRLLLCAALAEGTSSLHNIELSEDIEATLRCVEALGARIGRAGDGMTVTGCGGAQRTGDCPRFDCGESGSTLRFLIPVALAVCGGGDFTGRGRLMQRPQGPYETLFRAKGIVFERRGELLRVRGTLKPGRYALPGDVSSQFFTGLLLALPLLGGESVIQATSPPESADYIELTRQAQRLAGVDSRAEGARFAVAPQRYRAFEAAAEADWSQAAFWIAAAGLGSAVRVDGLNMASAQGDRHFADFAERLAAPGDVTIDVRDCPDLVPPLAALAAVRQGTCRLQGAARLRLKESDRLASVTAALRAMGGEVREESDALELRGLPALRGGATIDCAGDHRIAMMSAIAATRCQQSVVLRGADCVKKSYPAFWDDYCRLGGECHVLE